MYTMSQIRNRVNALKRKYATELKILKVFPIAEEFSLDWACMAADRLPLPQSGDFIRHLASWGFRFHTYTNLHQYLEHCRERGDIPTPWASCPVSSPRCPGTGWPTCCPTTSLPGNTRAGLPPKAMKSSAPACWSWPQCAASPRPYPAVPSPPTSLPRRALATSPPWTSLPRRYPAVPRPPASLPRRYPAVPRPPASLPRPNHPATTTTGPPAAGSSARPKSSPGPRPPAPQPCGNPAAPPHAGNHA